MANNKHKPDFVERTLIRLKREYGKDELVATLNRQIAEKDVEIGQLKAEVDHLQFRLESKMITPDEKRQFLSNIGLDKPMIIPKPDPVLDINTQARIECRKDELYKGVLRQNKDLRNRLKKLNNDYDNLMAKYCASTKKEESVVMTNEVNEHKSDWKYT